MYIEQLKQFNVFELFPSLKVYEHILFDTNYDTNLIVNTLNNDYSFVFEQIIQKKYKDNPIKKMVFKENPYQSNEFAFLIDCNEWTTVDLHEFIIEYSNLTSVIMRPNLFILFNVDTIDKNTQNVIGTLIEKNYKTARYWLICSQINKILNKIIHRCMYLTVLRPNHNHFKHMLIKILNKPMFEIIMDKICYKSNYDYGLALLYLDMLSIDSSVLNRDLFALEINEITQFITDQCFIVQNYPKIREICFRLLEKNDLIDIFYTFMIYFASVFTSHKYGLIVSRAAYYQTLDKIPNKQVWLLESWFLDCYMIYWDKMKSIY
jgi:hypothetical protein